MADCWPLQLPPTQKAVLISLADQANDQGFCWPSVATLCERTCLAERTVRLAIRGLEGEGLLKVEIGAMKANRYTLIPRRSPDGAPPDAAPPARPPPRARGGGHHMPPGTTCPPARGAPLGGTTCPLTIIEPKEIPPNPPLPDATGGAAAPSAAKPKRSAALSLSAWLAQCAERGEEAIPAGDPVFAYADRVGIGRDLLQLHWREFKARRLVNGKRQADWRQTFRNSVRDNWFRLWFLPPGKPAELTSLGRQALAAQAGDDITTTTTGEGDASR
jgi:hypothetical protein